MNPYPAITLSYNEARSLRIAAGEHVETVAFDPHSGDYRAFYFGIATTHDGGETWTYELHRQAPGFPRRMFELLTMTLSKPSAEGSCTIESLHTDAGLDRAELPALLPMLADAAYALKQHQRPADTVIDPFLSHAAAVLWTKPLCHGGAP